MFVCLNIILNLKLKIDMKNCLYTLIIKKRYFRKTSNQTKKNSMFWNLYSECQHLYQFTEIDKVNMDFIKWFLILKSRTLIHNLWELNLTS